LFGREWHTSTKPDVAIAVDIGGKADMACCGANVG